MQIDIGIGTFKIQDRSKHPLSLTPLKRHSLGLKPSCLDCVLCNAYRRSLFRVSSSVRGSLWFLSALSFRHVLIWWGNRIFLRGYLPALQVSLVSLAVLLHPAFHRGLEVLVLLGFLSDLCLPFLLANLLNANENVFNFTSEFLSINIHVLYARSTVETDENLVLQYRLQWKPV
jgi:hypothetical protein